MASETVADRLRKRIDEHGPIPVAEYLEHALYGPDGFYMSGGRAGRRGDFLTAPEVGPLFGAVVARAVDSWWEDLGCPSPFTVLEWGAGPGTLARSVLAAEPAVLSSGALRWVMIERSSAQRELHPEHEQTESVAPEDVASVDAGVIVANELLDNLAFDVIERRADGWAEIRVGVADGQFVEERLPVAAPVDLLSEEVPVGARIPRQSAAREWLADATESVGRGRVVVLDYGAGTAELAARDGGWLRTHAAHDGSRHWLEAPGSSDITSDVDFDQLQLDRSADLHESQAEWLRRHGIDELVAEGRAVWEASAGVGDLAALRARSRISEAEALLDPSGMGAFHVLEWAVGADDGVGQK